MEEELIQGGISINFENYRTEDGKLILYVNTEWGYEDIFLAEDVTVTIGNQAASVEDVMSFAGIDEGISFVCLVDVSGSLDKERMEWMKSMLTQLTEDMGENDSICIIAMGDELRSSGFLTDKEALSEVIDNLSVLKEDTNLYQGIENALNLLETDSTVSAKRCLIVLSDGADDNTYGITKEEADTLIKDSHIPVYTIGMLKNENNQKQVEDIKLLGSFARASAGGIHYVPKIDDMAPEETAWAIRESLLGGKVIVADISDLEPSGKEVYLRILVENDIIGSADTGINIADNILLSGKTADETKENPDESTQTDTEGESENTETEIIEETQAPQKPSTDNTSLILWGGIAGVILLIIVLVIFLFSLKRKKKKQEKWEEEQRLAALAEQEQANNLAEPAGEAIETAGLEQESNTAPMTEGTEASRIAAQNTAVSENFSQNLSKEAAEPVPSIQMQPTPEGNVFTRPVLHVQMFRMGLNENIVYSLQVADCLRMGRSPQADLPLTDDKSLSGIHCLFSYREDGLYVTDNHSTNGTYLNGVPIKGTARVASDDILLAGSYEYRICF